MTTQLTIADIVRAALDEFSGVGGVSDEDIDAFLANLGVRNKIVEIVIEAMEASMADLTAEVRRRLLAGQTVGEAYKKG